ncbi:MAG: ABC transporter permease [Butyricicoccus sp.]
MRLISSRSFWIGRLLLASLLLVVCLAPKQRPALHSPAAFLIAIALIELFFWICFWRKSRNNQLNKGLFDILSFVWLCLLLWELTASVRNLAHPVLVPAPENVFFTFYEQWRVLLLNVAYSMQLLVIGFFTGMIAAVLLGMICGWFPRLRDFAYPIANVMAPIPAVVFSPYLVAIMPSFRSASAVVIILGVFWPTFLTTINRVNSIEPQILDSARMLNLSNGTMIRSILLPYLLPGIVSGLRVSVTTSLLMLNFAELMGATHGMGYYVQNSITYANYTHAVAGIITIGIVVTLLSSGVAWIQTHAIPWK